MCEYCYRFHKYPSPKRIPDIIKYKDTTWPTPKDTAAIQTTTTEDLTRIEEALPESHEVKYQRKLPEVKSLKLLKNKFRKKTN